VAHVGVDLRLQTRHLGAELDVQFGQRVAVDGNAGRLHVGQDRDQRQLDLAE